MSAFEHGVRASAPPLVHPAEESSPRPRIQWSSVSLSDTMQQRCYEGTVLFLTRTGTFLLDRRGKPAKGLLHPLPEHLCIFCALAGNDSQKKKKKNNNQKPCRATGARLVNILLPCALAAIHDEIMIKSTAVSTALKWHMSDVCVCVCVSSYDAGRNDDCASMEAVYVHHNQ